MTKGSYLSSISAADLERQRWLADNSKVILSVLSYAKTALASAQLDRNAYQVAQARLDAIEEMANAHGRMTEVLEKQTESVGLTYRHPDDDRVRYVQVEVGKIKIDATGAWTEGVAYRDARGGFLFMTTLDRWQKRFTPDSTKPE